jgi:hypothetical protein
MKDMKAACRGSEAQEAPGSLAPQKLMGDVAQIISFLAETIKPEKIFMLHHPALDSERETGYVDLLVVLPCKSHIRFTEHQAIVEFANLRHRQVTCSLHRSDAVREALEQGHIFYSLACRPDKLVYDDGGEQFPATSKNLYKEIVVKARKVFEANFQKSQAIYSCSLQLSNTCNIAVAAFLLHQATEFVYRAVLLSLTGKEVRTHSIKALIKHSRRCAPQLDLVFPHNTPEERQLVHFMEESYLKARYDQDFKIDEATIELLFNRVQMLQDMSRQVFERKVMTYSEI